jgi:hypothetical protein
LSLELTQEPADPAVEEGLDYIKEELYAAWRSYPRPFVNAHEAHSVIAEEFAEFWDEVRRKPGDRNSSRCRRELVQLAAMCLRALCEVDWHAP